MRGDRRVDPREEGAEDRGQARGPSARRARYRSHRRPDPTRQARRSSSMSARHSSTCRCSRPASRQAPPTSTPRSTKIPRRSARPRPGTRTTSGSAARNAPQPGVTAILGAGFDPGVVNAYARLAKDDYFDRIDSIDIIDINAGSHGRYFATNFDPEINFREFTGQVWSWQNGEVDLQPDVRSRAGVGSAGGRPAEGVPDRP